MANIAGRETRVRLEQILEQGIDRTRGEPLLRALSLRYEMARRLLEAMRRGLRADLTRREFRRFFGDTDALATRASHAEKCFSSQRQRAPEIVMLKSARHAVNLS